MLETDVEDEISWWQLFDVAESVDGSTLKSYPKLAQFITQMNQDEGEESSVKRSAVRQNCQLLH